MSVTLVVVLCGVCAALLAFGLSVSRRMRVDLLDTAVEERAVRQSILAHPKLSRFLRERMDRKTAGGFLLTASFLVMFVVALFVGALLSLIDNNNWLAEADGWVAGWGSHHSSSDTVDVLRWATHLGGTPFVVAALTTVAVVDYARRRSLEVFAFVAAVGLGQLALSNVLKVLVSRDRPSVLRLVAAHGYSFPSGHTVAASATFSAIALVLGRDRHRRTRTALGACATLIAVSVAATRALLGVHWLTDVLAGLAIGWGWFTIVAIMFGGRAQRLGDPVSDDPQGIDPSTTSPSQAQQREVSADGP